MIDFDAELIEFSRDLREALDIRDSRVQAVGITLAILDEALIQHPEFRSCADEYVNSILKYYPPQDVQDIVNVAKRIQKEVKG